MRACWMDRPMSQRILVEEFNRRAEPGDPALVEVELGKFAYDVILEPAELLGASVAVVKLRKAGVYAVTRVRVLEVSRG